MKQRSASIGPWADVARRPAGRDPDQDLRRRVIYLMLFRLVLISLVLGTTILIAWLSPVDLRAPSSLVLFAIIGTTYLLTILYALAVSRIADLRRLADIQLTLDLIISAFLVHVTGGAQSAYTFFFPLSIIAAAAIRFRTGAVVIALLSVLLFSAVCVLGWLQLLPVPAGQSIVPSDLSLAELGRALALNLAAFVGVAMLAYNLGAQIQQTSASLETQRTVAADLYALHEDIVRSLSSGLITVDAHDEVLTINRAARELLELAPQAALGRPVDELLPGVQATLSQLVDRAAVRRIELVVRQPGRGDKILGLSVSPLRNNRDEVIGRIINFQDLTELRKMEQQMRQAERLAAIGSLAAGVAHEIRNPLAAISGSIELLRSSPQADEENRALMAIVTREVDRLNTLITDLLDYTNPQPRDMVRCDLTGLVRETLQVFEQDRGFRDVRVVLAVKAGPENEADHETDHETEVEPAAADAGAEPDDIAVIADPGRIRQLLWNILRNGAEAARSQLTVRVYRRQGAAIIEIEDDGPGIPRENMERIFEPFFTTKTQGTGLGLATCHSIIREHGGSIHAENQATGGCRFVISLPASLDARSDRPVAYTGAHD